MSACQCPRIYLVLPYHTVQSIVDLLTDAGERFADDKDSRRFTDALDTKAELIKALREAGYGVD